MLSKLFNKSPAEPLVPRVPPGVRVYAIGDVHGRLDLLRRLIATIELDAAIRGAARNHIVMLGDYIDRGPDSRGVIEFLRTYRHPHAQLTMLSGNHEEVLLRLLNGESGVLRDWLKFGGAQTLASYGAELKNKAGMTEAAALAVVRQAIPREHREFLEALGDTVRIGDYLFVHAGIRPAVHLSVQAQQDLRWIREPFLNDDSDHGFVVVHGHTISRDVVERSNRIGIDTGAYSTGRLSAVGLEGDKRWFLDATA